MTARAKQVRGTAFLLAALALGGCGQEGASSAPGQVDTLATDSASNPTAAIDPRTGRAYVAWIGVSEGLRTVLVVSAGPGADAPSARVRANDLPGDAAPHAQAPAQLAIGPEGNVYVVWQNNTPVPGRRFPASNLRLATSTDGGRTFRPAVDVNDDADGPPSSHTFHDISVAADGTVLVSWIDSREVDAAIEHANLGAELLGTATNDAHAHHGTSAAGAVNPSAASDTRPVAAKLRGPEIRVARSRDFGATFGAGMVVDSAACPCCRTSLVVAPDGAVYVAWRKLFPGDIRDVVVARAEPGSLEFGAPVRVHRDEWVFPGCPHAGPSLAVDEAGRLLVGWYTGKQGRQGLWYAASEDGGRTFAEATPMLTADWVPPSQLRLAVAGGRVWAAWEDRTGEGSVVRIAAGRAGEPLRPLESFAEPGSNPSLAAVGDKAVVAWLDGGAVRARVLKDEG
jgi:hypothetical protein